MENCIFCKIARGEIPSRKLFEDEDALAFHDVRPLAPVHFLVVPKIHVASLADLTDEDQALMGTLMVLASRLAREQGCANGFRTIINTGPVGGQEVHHLHIHIVGGSEPLGPMLAKR